MFISLKVENEERLPAGSSVDYKSEGHDFEIGRQGSDWTLPDPDRIISSKHCRVEYRADGFLLHDLSRNGTFVNGSRERIAAPYRLRHGDRLRIGRYIVRVTLDDVGEPRRPNPPDAGFAVPSRTGTSARNGSLSFGDDPFLVGSGSAGVEDHPRPPQGRQEFSREPSDVSARSSPPQATSDELLRRIADAAGIPPETLLQREGSEVAAEIGAVLRIVVEGLAMLLKARAAAKGMVKSSQRTMIGGTDNNPLKFVPSTEEILDIMFSRRRPGYMDAARSVEDAFRDLKTHEIATYAAMQTALARLLEDISPDTIEKKIGRSSFGSRKARAWDALLAAWAAREEVHENGMLDVFLAYFSEAYADASKER